MLLPFYCADRSMTRALHTPGDFARTDERVWYNRIESSHLYPKYITILKVQCSVERAMGYIQSSIQ